MSFPQRPVTRPGEPPEEMCVVCLDCAKQFAYDLKTMQIGRAVDHKHDTCVIPELTKPRKRTLAYLLGLALPVALLVGGG